MAIVLAALQATVLAGTARAAAPVSVQLTVTASASTRVGLQVFANANLMNAVTPSGTVTFTLFPPADSSCSSAVFTSTVPVTGSSVNSERFTVTQPGVWRWVASYSGDANNGAAGPTPCAGPASTVIVDKARPVLAVRAALLTVGSATLHAGASLNGGADPTGTITFQLHRDLPTDSFCAAPAVFTSVVPVSGAGTYDSGNFTATASGTYRWRATYSGDDKNLAVSLTGCLDAAASVVVTVPLAASAPVPAPAPASAPAGLYSPLTPARILDTRNGTGGVSGPIGSGATVEVPMTGRGGTPASGVAAVAVNVSVTGPSNAGYVTLYPGGGPRPPTATLNFAPGETVSILAIVKVSTEGKVAMFNATGTTHVVVDVAGWYSDAGGRAGGRYQALTSARILDTRDGTGGAIRLGPNTSVDVAVSGRGGVPATGADAAVLNVAAVGASADSFLTVYPTGEPRPWAANLNVVAGHTASNRTITKLGAGGKVTIFNAGGSADVVVDAGGWFTDSSVPGTAGGFAPLTPARTLDTRDGISEVPGPIAGGRAVDVQVTGLGGVPATGVSAVALTATVTQPASAGYLTLSPSGAPQPVAADLNFDGGETGANLVIVKVGTGGRITMSSSATTHVVFDVSGWFS